MLQPGHPQIYCSELCRRTAQKERQRLRSRLIHLESMVLQTKADLVAHGTDDDVGPDTTDGEKSAQLAIARAGGVLRFVKDADDPIAIEFRALYESVAHLTEPPNA